MYVINIFLLYYYYTMCILLDRIDLHYKAETNEDYLQKIHIAFNMWTQY